MNNEASEHGVIAVKISGRSVRNCVSASTDWAHGHSVVRFEFTDLASAGLLLRETRGSRVVAISRGSILVDGGLAMVIVAKKAETYVPASTGGYRKPAEDLVPLFRMEVLVDA